VDNYNTALISQVENIRAPQFRAISSEAFHSVLDETKVNAALIRSTVDKEYDRINWNDSEINKDPEFLRHFVRRLSEKVQSGQQGKATLVKLRTFINNVVEGFAVSPEGIDQLRKRSVLVQVAILSVPMPADVDEAVRQAYRDICKEAGLENVPVAVRSSAAGEDSRKKAFAGLQDTYLNIVGEQAVVTAYQWDCASAYNLRSMTYRRESILDVVALAESTGDESLVENAKKEWAIENTSLSVCLMRMINPVISGTAFSADTATPDSSAAPLEDEKVDNAALSSAAADKTDAPATSPDAPSNDDASQAGGGDEGELKAKNPELRGFFYAKDQQPVNFQKRIKRFLRTEKYKNYAGGLERFWRSLGEEVDNNGWDEDKTRYEWAMNMVVGDKFLEEISKITGFAKGEVKKDMIDYLATLDS